MNDAPFLEGHSSLLLPFSFTFFQALKKHPATAECFRPSFQIDIHYRHLYAQYDIFYSKIYHLECLATESIPLFSYIIFTIHTLRKNNHYYSFFNTYFCNNAITSSDKCSPLRYHTNASAIVSAPSYILSAYADTPLNDAPFWGLLFKFILYLLKFHNFFAIFLMVFNKQSFIRIKTR